MDRTNATHCFAAVVCRFANIKGAFCKHIKLFRGCRDLCQRAVGRFDEGEKKMAEFLGPEAIERQETNTDTKEKSLSQSDNTNMLRRRGQAIITTPVKEPKAQHKIRSMATNSFQILKNLLVLSVFFGYRHRRYRLFGFLGGLMWLVCLLAHGGFDFLAARRNYGYGWASVSLFFFLSLCLCTVTTNRKLLPWLESGMLQLEEKKYRNTLRRITKVVKWLPLGVLVFGLLTAGTTMFCLYMDGTLDVSFAEGEGDEPFNISYNLQIILKTVRFLCTCYVMCAFAYFWCVAVCVMHMTGFSMIEYHEEMTLNLKNTDCPVTFRQAVHSFAARGNFVKYSASACRVTLAFLLIFSIASLAVNAFLFLYKTRRATFAVFALLPTICSVYPLCAAAWVTKQYKWYLAVVVKAWAERPESSDEENESESDETLQRKHEKQKRKRGKSLWKRKAAVLQDRKPTVKPPLRESQSNPLSLQTQDAADKSQGNASRNKSVSLSDNETSRVEDLPTVTRKNLAPLLSPGSLSDTDISEDDRVRPETDQGRLKTMGNIFRGAARVVGKLQRRRKLPKFNFEKYITYLQNVLPNLGFNIMGIIVTWNMVSTIIFLELSLLALFVQESIFGNEKATVSL